MQKVGMTEEEIADVLKCDKEIDRGAKLFELEKDLQAGAKKARRADRTDTPKQAVRERKEDVDKRELILVITDALCDVIEGGAEIVNPEREILFTHNGRKFKVVLSAPRTQEQVRLLLFVRKGAEFGKITNFEIFYFDFFVQLANLIFPIIGAIIMPRGGDNES